MDGTNRTLSKADVDAVASATVSMLIRSEDFIALITNIIDGELDVKLKPVRTGLRLAGEGLLAAGADV